MILSSTLFKNLLQEEKHTLSMPLYPERSGTWVAISDRDGSSREFTIDTFRELLDFHRIIVLTYLKNRVIFVFGEDDDDECEIALEIDDMLVAGASYYQDAEDTYFIDVTEIYGVTLDHVAILLHNFEFMKLKDTYPSHIQITLEHGNEYIELIKNMGFEMSDDLRLGAIYKFGVDARKISFSL